MGDVYSRFQAITSIQRTLTTSFVEVILDGIMSIATLLMMLGVVGSFVRAGRSR